MIYGLMAAWGAALLSLVWGLYQRWRASVSIKLMADYLNVKAQIDRLTRENADFHEINTQMHQAANEFQATLTKTELGYLAQLKDRDEALVAMRLQLDEARLDAHDLRMERDNEASENRALKLQLPEATKPRRHRKGQPVSTDVAE